MWEAFFGGEYEGYDPNQNYLEQTQSFYENIIGPAFLGGDEGEGFGTTSLEGWYAAFDPQKFEQAEEIFRSEIGDPYVSGQDPFAWEKVSRYDTSGGAESRIQQLLESELYGQGKFLGGEAGAEYGTSTAKELETYTAGLAGEREGLTYEALTSGVGVASGTSGATIRSGGATAVSEDVLIEAYKKAKTLGSEYRAGTKGVEETLEKDLNAALGKYLETIDTEKERWFQDVLRNVQTFRRLEGGEYEDLNDQQVAEKLTYLETRPEYQEWGCGYGQIADPENPGECMDDPTMTIGGQDFRGDTCGIGEIWNPELNEGAGGCEIRTDLELSEDSYGYLCPPEEIDECGDCWGPGPEENYDCDHNCIADEDCFGTCGGTAVVDECGVCDGDGAPCGDDTKDDMKDIIEGETDTDEGLTGSCIDSSDCGSCERCDMGFCLHVGMNSPNGCDEDDYDDDDDEQQCPQGQIKTETGNCIEVEEVEVYGCSDKTANNYNSDATVEDGSCEYDEEDEEDKVTCWDGEEVDDISQCAHQSCVETGCSEYGSQYVCNEETGYCQDPDKLDPGKGPKPGDEGEIDCPYGQIWDGSNCVFPPRDEIKDGEECAGGLIMCGGNCICLPGEICSEGECIPEDTDWDGGDGWGPVDPDPGRGPWDRTLEIEFWK